MVVNVLLPELRRNYGDLQTDQEDWGWFVWFRRNSVSLGVDVFCDDPGSGRYRVHLTSRVSRWFFGDRVVNGPELEELRKTVTSILSTWLGEHLQAVRLDSNHRPMESLAE